MQKIKIDGNSFKFPTSYSDCEVWRAKACLFVWDLQTEDFKDAIQNEPESIKESEWLNFLISWVSAVTEARDELIQKVHIVDLNKIWELTQYILSSPENVLHLTKLKGVSITESVKTLSGVEVIGGKATYQQWSLLNQLNTMMSASTEVKKLDTLKKMLTIIYPVQDEKAEDLKKRLNSYENISILKLYSGWFFFAILLNGWKIVIQSLGNDQSNPREVAKINIKLARMQLLRSLERSIFGKYMGITWQKQMRWLVDLTK